MYGCESWTVKKADCQRIDAFELCIPLDWKEIKPVNPEGTQSWIFIRRTDAEAPVLWPPDVKSWLIGKDPDAGKDWRQEKGTTEDEMAGWLHRLNGHEFEQALGVGEGQGSLACCSSWGCKESDMTERLSNNNNTVMNPLSQSTHKIRWLISVFQIEWSGYISVSLLVCNLEVMQFLKLILNLGHLYNFRFVYEVGPLIFYVAWFRFAPLKFA